MMGMTHAGFMFSGRYGLIGQSPIRQSHQRYSHPGVKGISILAGVAKERILQVPYMIDGETSAATLQATLDAISAHQGESGTLQVTGGTSAITHENCFFEHFAPSGPPGYSAGGQEGHLQHGTLIFTQFLTS